MHANEKVAPTHHEFIHPAKTKAGDPSGYVAREYQHQEYPKQIGDRVVKSAEEEKALRDSEQKAAAKPVKE